MLDSQRITKFLKTVPVHYAHFQVTGRYRFQELLIEVKVWYICKRSEIKQFLIVYSFSLSSLQ